MNEEEIRRLELEAEAEAEAEYEYSQLQKQSAGPPGQSGEIPQPESAITTNVRGAASGFLDGVADIGDMVDAGIKGITGTSAVPSPGLLGPGVRSIADTLTGVKDSTNLEPDSYAYKAGSYLPSTMAGGPSLVGKGVIGGLKAAGGMLANDAVISGGGYLGNKVGGPVGEIIGSLGASLGMAGVSKALNSVADVIAPPTPEEAAVQNLGVTKGMMKKAERFNPAGAYDEPNLVQAIRGGQERGVFQGATDAPSLLAKNDQAMKELGLATDGILMEADAMKTQPAIPVFKESQAFKDAHAAEPGILKRFQEHENLVSQVWDGSISSLNRAKQMMQSIGYSSANTSTEKQLDRLFAFDLKNSVEQSVKNILGDDAMKSVATLNGQLGEHIKLHEVFQAKKIADSTAQINPASKGNSVFKITPRGAIESGGLAGSVAALASGHPMTAAISLGALGAGKALQTNTGRSVVSNVLGAASEPSLGAIAAGPVSTLNNITTGVSPSPPVSRNWEQVKSNPIAKQTIAMLAANSGLSAGNFWGLPEPLQREIHKNLTQVFPQAFEKAPNNLSLANDEYLNPIEKDAVVRQHRDSDPETRAMVIGSSFQNKYIPPKPQQLPAMPPRALPSVMEKVSRWSREPLSQSAPMATGSTDMLSQMEELTRNKLDHAQDR